MLWVSLSEFSWNELKSEPLGSLIPLAGAAWLTFAIGLFFGRGWAWFGSFIFTVFSVFAGIWIAMQSVLFEGRGEIVFDLGGISFAVAVLGMLLHTRHSFLREHESTV